MKKRLQEIREYDHMDTSQWIDRRKQLSLKDLGFTLPPEPPTQVVSIRLPTRLLNALRAKASSLDVPYQSLIKLTLSRFIRQKV